MIDFGWPHPATGRRLAEAGFTGLVSDVMTLQALNRATLARQLLLAREPAPASPSGLAEVVERLGALQAQRADAPYYALLARLEGFEAGMLRSALEAYALVRATLHRGTLHTVSARDFAGYASYAETSLFPLVWKGFEPVDAIDRCIEEALDFCDRSERGTQEMKDFGEELFGRLGPVALDVARGSHGFRTIRSMPWLLVSLQASDFPNASRASYVSARSRLGVEGRRDVERDPDLVLTNLVRSYLRAFGPASDRDVMAWLREGRVSRVRAIFERLRGEGAGGGLVEFVDETGRRLVDLPDAPRPDPETPVPVRLLARFDSLLLAYGSGHRTRVLPEAYRPRVFPHGNGTVLATFLVGGMVAGTWDVRITGRRVETSLDPFVRLTKRVRAQLDTELGRVHTFVTKALADRAPAESGHT